jgi:hypothetical protein
MSLDESDALTLTAALRRMSLIAIPTKPRRWSHSTGGVSSLIVLAHTRRGPVCIKSALARLKVAAEWLAPVERNTAEVAWMRLAAGIVPDSVPAILGEDRVSRAFAMAYLDPRDHPVWKTHLLAGRVDRHGRDPAWRARWPLCTEPPPGAPIWPPTLPTTPASSPCDWTRIWALPPVPIPIAPAPCRP